MNKLQRARGFSLIELMVVIVIIGIILAIAIPSFTAMIRRSRGNAATEGLAQEIRNFRERAISISGTYQISFPSNKTYLLTRPDATTDLRKLGSTTGGNLKFGVTFANNTTGFTASEPYGAIPGDGIDLPGKVLTISNRGSMTHGVIYITNGKEDYAIGMNTLGKVKIYRWGTAQWD